jgi:ABC-type nitrate/sulfonate/bicarbonate transport system substrate-binding protein
MRGLSRIAVLILLVLTGTGLWLYLTRPDASGGALRIAVPPFVDTAMPVAGQKVDLFTQQGARLQLVDTTWENQYELIAGGALDISMSTVDEFINKDKNLRAANRRVIFILPAWQFRGLGFYTSASFKTLAELRQTVGVDAAKTQFLAQLMGHKVVVPEGSVFESGLREFLKGSGVDTSKVQIVNAALDTALNALSDRDVALVAVGSQQRFEAERRGYREAIAPEDLGLDVLTGFIARAEVWEKRKTEVLAFACGWYATVRLVNGRADKGYSDISGYLSARGAGTLTPSEYEALRKYNVFAATPAQAKELFFEPQGAAYWKRVWDRTIAAMQAAGKEGDAPPDSSGFVAPTVNSELVQKCPG